MQRCIGGFLSLCLAVVSGIAGVAERASRIPARIGTPGATTEVATAAALLLAERLSHTQLAVANQIPVLGAVTDVTPPMPCCVIRSAGRGTIVRRLSRIDHT
jgi:hypothetical protein